MISGTSRAESSALSQLQLQQAQRNVQQAQARAESLSNEAASARKEAQKAERRAHNLELEAGSAKNKADTAASAVSRSQQFDRFGNELVNQLNQTAKDRIASSESETYFSDSGQLTASSSSSSIGLNVDVTA